MFATILSMIVIIAVACIVVGMVVVGVQESSTKPLPELANTLAIARRHLNGEAPPPRGLVAFFEEAESGAEELKAGLRRSASSARTGRTAPSARSAVSPSGLPRPKAMVNAGANSPTSDDTVVSPWDGSLPPAWEAADNSAPISPIDVFASTSAPGRSVWATWESPQDSD